MANISSAFGTMTVQSKNKEAIAKMLMLINYRLATCEYDTYLDNAEVAVYNNFDENLTEIQKFINNNIVEKDGRFTVVDNFGGDGRWSYETNLENFKRWVQTPAAYRDKKESNKINKKLDQYFKDIELEDIILSFDYTDYEWGCQFLMQGNITYQWKTWSKINENRNYLDFTAENLRNLCGINEACDFTKESLQETLEILKTNYSSIRTKINENPRLEQQFFEKFVNYKTSTFSNIEEMLECYPEVINFFDENK